MAYLIDTQILVWALVSPEKLSLSVRRILQADAVYVSITSLLEIAIKQKTGKLPELPVTTDDLVKQLKKDGFALLPVTVRHIAAYDLIPLHPDHRDPFDRLILATALAEQMPAISADEKFSRYRDTIEVIW